MGKRGNGEGSIYRRKDGRWAGQHTIQTATGPKRKTVYAKTRAEVSVRAGLRVRTPQQYEALSIAPVRRYPKPVAGWRVSGLGGEGMDQGQDRTLLDG